MEARPSSTPEVRYSLLRDLAAVIIVAVACPVAIFLIPRIGCIGTGFSSDCAMGAVAVSPVLLIAAGAAAGSVTRGWTGALLVFAGTVIGMTSILVLSFGVFPRVPLDPISGVIATIWFFAPISAGYGLGRLVWRLITRARGGGAR